MPERMFPQTQGHHPFIDQAVADSGFPLIRLDSDFNTAEGKVYHQALLAVLKAAPQGPHNLDQGM